jgi:hypothetical protein
VVMVSPITTFTVPITIMLVMPIIIVPVAVSMIVVGHRRQRTANYRSEHCNR